MIAGALLIAGIVAALASRAVEHPVLTGMVSLARVPPSAARLSAGGLIELLAAGASAGIAISLGAWLILRGFSHSAAQAPASPTRRQPGATGHVNPRTRPGSAPLITADTTDC